MPGLRSGYGEGLPGAGFSRLRFAGEVFGGPEVDLGFIAGGLHDGEVGPFDLTGSGDALLAIVAGCGPGETDGAGARDLGGEVLDRRRWGAVGTGLQPQVAVAGGEVA